MWEIEGDRMTHDVFDTQEELIEVTEVDQDHIVLYFPAAKASGDEQHAWKASIRLELAKEVAIQAGMPEEIFNLDHFHY